ncbi:MAG: SusD/RagB family nutrient-binding outer membrane lipoprotein, partial [Bacteroidetes bacterium]|nr:SusD/RagB family nutrient-binding outer membrane lipoprotein [Bacteroidota bacterium]
RTFSQYWTETTYTDESNYNITTRAIPDFEFRTQYRDVLNNLKEAKRVIPTESALVSNAAEKKNRIAITEILSVYSFQRLVDIFGNIPYDNALDIDKISPSYDDAQGIYSKLFARLDAAIGSIDINAACFGDADLIYGGDAGKWKTFAYSLKLKMAITVADVPALDPAEKATSAVTGGVMSSTADNASFAYLSSSPNTNPVWVELVASGRYDWVATNTLVDKMNLLKDPRRDDYFAGNIVDSTGAPMYKGGIYAKSNKYGSYTHITPTVQLADRPALLIDYTEVQFYLAEAVERGFIGGSATTYYNEGITSSILFWGGTTTDAITYLANPDVAYATASGTFKEKIGTQAWLAYYDRGLIAWTTWRRLDAPIFNPPSGKTIADIPTRYTYPINEQTLNGANYKSAASAIGGDLITTKLFWDKF